MLMLPPLYPNARLVYFAPFLVTYYYQHSYLASTWMAFACGLIVDLLSDQRFGVNAFVYVLTTLMLYRQRRHFFSDSVFTLPIMVYLFAFISTFFLGLMAYLEAKGAVGDIKSAITGLVLMPLFDFVYALVLFTMTSRLLTSQRGRRRSR
jgi:rod shape-determining protein MreD